MALAMTGRVADGVILQLADPDLIRWFVAQVREAAEAAGRDPASIKVQAAAPAHVGTREVGRERTRWFPALVSNHVVDLVNKYPREQLPDSLTGYITDRTGYDYLHHAEVGSSNASFVGDEVTDRFCVLGLRRGPRREAARARRRRRGPVQPVPDERRRGGPGGAVRPRGHPRLPGLAIAPGVDAETGTLPTGHPYARLEHGTRVVLVIPGLTLPRTHRASGTSTRTSGLARGGRRARPRRLADRPARRPSGGLDGPGHRRRLRRGRPDDVPGPSACTGSGPAGRTRCGWRSAIRTSSPGSRSGSRATSSIPTPRGPSAGSRPWPARALAVGLRCGRPAVLPAPSAPRLGRLLDARSGARRPSQGSRGPAARRRRRGWSRRHVRLEAIHCPTLVVSGGRDGAYPPGSSATCSRGCPTPSTSSTRRPATSDRALRPPAMSRRSSPRTADRPGATAPRVMGQRSLWRSRAGPAMIVGAIVR